MHEQGSVFLCVLISAHRPKLMNWASGQHTDGHLRLGAFISKHCIEKSKIKENGFNIQNVI